MADEETPAARQEQQNTTEESRTAPEGEQDWKALARKWEHEAKKNTKALTAQQEELERLRQATQSDTEKAIEAARREGRKAAESEWKPKWRSERIRGEALRAMNGRVSDPRLAFPHLNLGDEVLDDDGNVDMHVLNGAIDALLEEYPALGTGLAPTGPHHADLGPKRTATAPSQDMNTLLRRAAGRA